MIDGAKEKQQQKVNVSKCNCNKLCLTNALDTDTIALTSHRPQRPLTASQQLTKFG